MTLREGVFAEEFHCKAIEDHRDVGIGDRPQSVEVILADDNIKRMNVGLSEFFDDQGVDAPRIPRTSDPRFPKLAAGIGGTRVFIADGECDFLFFGREELIGAEVRLNVDGVLSGPPRWKFAVVIGEEAVTDSCEVLPSRPVPRGAIERVKFDERACCCVARHIEGGE